MDDRPPYITMRSEEIELFYNLLDEGEGIIAHLNFNEYANIEPGSRVIWEIPGEGTEIETEVTEVMKYNTFSTMLEIEGRRYCLFSNETDIDYIIKNHYRKLYTEKEEDKYGVVAFKLFLQNAERPSTRTN